MLHIFSNTGERISKAIIVQWLFLCVCLADYDKDGAYVFKSVIVEATRKKNRLHLPTSSSIITAAAFRESGIWEPTDLAIRIPNLTIQDSSGNFTFITIRGLAPADSIVSNAAVYIDGVNYFNTTNLGNFLYDVESMEVFRGAQSIAYGRQATTGVLAISTHQPVNHRQGYLELTLGYRNMQRYEGVVNIPVIADKLHLRLAGVSWRQDGPTENILTGRTTDDIDQWSGRTTLQWLPMDSTTVTFRVNGDRFMGRGPGFVPEPLTSDAREISADYDKFVSELDTIHPSLEIVHEVDSFIITSITGYGKTDRDIDVDLDFTSADLLRRKDAENQEQYTQELRLDSNNESYNLNWSFGIYWFQENLSELDERELRPTLTGEIFSIFDVIQDDRDHDGFSVFGSLSLPLHERLRIVNALRYEAEEKSFQSETYDLINGNRVDKNVFSIDEHFEAWLPGFSAYYDWSDSISIFTSIARSFRSGGFNTRATSPRESEYAAEKAWTYEIGMISSWLEDRLHLNLTLFKTDISDLQIFQGLGSNLIIQNAGGGRTRGIETEMSISIFENLEVITAWGYNDTKYIDFIDPVSGSDFSGNKIAGAPNYNFTIACHYRRQLNSRISLLARLEYQGAGKVYFDESNSRSEHAYQLLNLRLGLETERWGCFFWGKNLTDEEYLLRIFDLPLNTNGEFGPPRTLGVTTRVAF